MGHAEILFSCVRLRIYNPYHHDRTDPAAAGRHAVPEILETVEVDWAGSVCPGSSFQPVAAGARSLPRHTFFGIAVIATWAFSVSGI